MSFGISVITIWIVIIVIVMDRCAGAGGVVLAFFSSWLWLLLVFAVVVLAINGAGDVVVLGVFIVGGSCCKLRLFVG